MSHISHSAESGVLGNIRWKKRAYAGWCNRPDDGIWPARNFTSLWKGVFWFVVLCWSAYKYNQQTTVDHQGYSMYCVIMIHLLLFLGKHFIAMVTELLNAITLQQGIVWIEHGVSLHLQMAAQPSGDIRLHSCDIALVIFVINNINYSLFI